jgi:hypothetical protein
MQPIRRSNKYVIIPPLSRPRELCSRARLLPAKYRPRSRFIARFFVERLDKLLLITLVLIFGLVYPVHVSKRSMEGEKFTVPAIPHHTDAFALSHAVESSTLFEVLLAPNSLSVTKTCFCKSITITPSCISRVSKYSLQ